MLKEILKPSLKIVWQNPLLWIFGFFSTFFFLSANEFFLIFIFSFLFFDLPDAQRISLLPQPTLLINPFLLILILLIILLLLFLSIFSEIFIILSTMKKIRGSVKKADRPIIFKVLSLRLLSILLLSLLWVILARHLISLPSLLSFFLIFFLSLFSLFLLFFIRYLVFYLVIERKNLSLSLKNSFYFLKENWLVSLKLSLIIFIIVLLYKFLIFSLLEAGTLTYPLRIFNLIFTGVFGKYGFWLVAIFALIVVLILQIALVGLIASYQIVSWVVLYAQKSKEISGKSVNNSH